MRAAFLAKKFIVFCATWGRNVNYAPGITFKVGEKFFTPNSHPRFSRYTRPLKKMKPTTERNSKTNDLPSEFRVLRKAKKFLSLATKTILIESTLKVNFLKNSLKRKNFFFPFILLRICSIHKHLKFNVSCVLFCWYFFSSTVPLHFAPFRSPYTALCVFVLKPLS